MNRRSYLSLLGGSLGAISGCSGPGAAQLDATATTESPSNESDSVLAEVWVTVVRSEGMEFSVSQLAHRMTTNHSAKFRLKLENPSKQDVTFGYLDDPIFDEADPQFIAPSCRSDISIIRTGNPATVGRPKWEGSRC